MVGPQTVRLDVWEYNSAGKIIERLQIHEPQIGNYVTAVLPLRGGGMAVGTYGKGVSIVNLPGTSDTWKQINSIKKNASSVSEPRGAKPPTREQLAALYHNLLETKIPQEYAGPQVIPISDDWRTQGTWLGRYGRYWACLFAIYPPPDVSDYVWEPGTDLMGHAEMIGPHRRRGGDVIRLYLKWLSTAN